MIQYFQLTPEILLEYVYNGDQKLDEDGIKGNEKNLCCKCNTSPCKCDTRTMLISSNAFKSKYLCFKNDRGMVDDFSNFVLPLNNTETQFVVVKGKYQNFFSRVNASNRFSTKNGSKLIYEDTNYDKDIISNGKSCDVKYDKCIIHFTSRNYFGIYDSLIFQTYVYMSNKAKLYLSSFLFKRTSNLELKPEHLLYKEKLYTTQIEFDIPSVYAILSNDSEIANIDFNNALKNQNIELLQNTPVGINVYGVSGSIKGVDNYEMLKTNKISSISIPYVYDKLDSINIRISEATDGDYFYIDPEIDGYSSFVEYIESMGEDIRSYMVMHELYLREFWIDEDNIPHSEITHKEFHIIDINEDDSNEEISKRFDAKIKYRPICIRSDKDCVATIIDKIKIINTVDNTSYEVTGSFEISNPYKYGKNLKRLNIKNESRPIVNVYNKKISTNSNSGSNDVVVLNKGGVGFTVENMSQNITSFIECTNVGVSIVELSPEEI